MLPRGLLAGVVPLAAGLAAADTESRGAGEVAQ